MIDAVAVEQIGAAPRALAEPAEILRRHDVPVVERHAPVLPGRAERVGRRADRHVEIELMLARPDVGAVAVDHERQIAEQRDAVRVLSRAPATACRRATAGTGGTAPRRDSSRRALIDRGRLAALQRRRPLRPRPLLLARVDGAKQAVVLEPPRLLAE